MPGGTHFTNTTYNHKSSSVKNQRISLFIGTEMMISNHTTIKRTVEIAYSDSFYTSFIYTRTKLANSSVHSIENTLISEYVKIDSHKQKLRTDNTYSWICVFRVGRTHQNQIKTKF